MRDPRKAMWAEACALLERADRLHRQFFEPAFSGPAGVRWEPPVDIFETPREVLVTVALPGVAPDDVQIGVESNVVIISGVRPLPSMARNAAIRRLEVPYGRFERRILLAANVKLEGRELLHGCLALTFQKSE
jgi:HSP20 family protein